MVFYTVESLEFVMAHFPWYLNPPKEKKRIAIFPTETENWRIHEITSPQIREKKPQSTKKSHT